MEIRWSALAADDLERICAWIERDNPEAARRVAKIIYEGCGPLGNAYFMGRRTGLERRAPDIVDKYESGRSRVDIRHVLIQVWDPIGIKDELSRSMRASCQRRFR